MILTEVDLQHSNTMRLPCIAAAALNVNTVDDLHFALRYAKEKGLDIRVIGGGSNVLLPPKLHALVLKPAMRGIDIQEQDDCFIVKAKAGENWHQFIDYLLQKRVHGLENLALIPGLVGASVIQNIGAYGLEVKDFIDSVEVFEYRSQQVQTLSAAECEFGYRDSLFKRSANQYFVLSVCFKLPKQAATVAIYPALKAALPVGRKPNPKELFDAVVAVRSTKLPDPKMLPNCGSFFKNPVVTYAHFEQLKKTYPDMPCYPQPNGDVKLAAGWLIEQCGWKGKGIGGVVMYEKQALVMVNVEGATLLKVEGLANSIVSSVKSNFGLCLNCEPIYL